MVLISWSVVVVRLESVIWILWGVIIVWILGFDIVYVMSDCEDDWCLGINFSVLFFGKYVINVVGIFFFLIIVLLGLLGIKMELYIGFWIIFGVVIIFWFI